MSGLDLADRLQQRQMDRIKQRRLERDVPEMDADELLEACVSNGGYETPELNDKLYLHFKGYRCINGEALAPYTNLKALFLDSNGLPRIENLGSLTNLRCLYLQKNLIERIEGLEALQELVTLDLSDNRITRVENLSGLPNLSTLNLNGNILQTAESVAHLQECAALRTLNLSDNQLEGAEVLDVVGAIPELVALNIKGNPVVTGTAYFRKTMIVNCPKLRYLDRPVFDNERVGALAWQEGGPEAERAARKALADEERAAHSRSLHEFRDWQNRLREERVAALAASASGDGSGEGEGEPICSVADRTPVQYATVSDEEAAERQRQRRELARREAELERTSVAGEGVRKMGKAYWELNGATFDESGAVVAADEPEDAESDKENGGPRALPAPPAVGAEGVDEVKAAEEDEDDDEEESVPIQIVEEDDRYGYPVPVEDDRYGYHVEEEPEQDDRYGYHVEEPEDDRYGYHVEETPVQPPPAPPTAAPAATPMITPPLAPEIIAMQEEEKTMRYALYEQPDDGSVPEDADADERQRLEAEEDARQERVMASLEMYKAQKRQQREAAAAAAAAPPQPDLVWTPAMDARAFALVNEHIFDFAAAAEALRAHHSVLSDQRALVTPEAVRLRYAALDEQGFEESLSPEEPADAADSADEEEAALLAAFDAALGGAAGAMRGVAASTLPAEFDVPYGEGEGPPTMEEMMAPYRPGAEPTQRKSFEQLMRETRPFAGVQVDLANLPSLSDSDDADDAVDESKRAEEGEEEDGEEEEDEEPIRPLTREELEAEIMMGLE